MNDEDQNATPAPRKEPEKGKFYAMGYDHSGYIHDVTIINEDDLIWDDDLVMFPPGRRPENPYPATPQLGFKKGSKKRKLPRDFDTASAHWLVTERLKGIFEAVDPEGFVFVACEFTLPDGSKGPQYYLCDVLRTVDALDEEASIMKPPIFEPSGRKIYDLVGIYKLAFKRRELENIHVFRTPFTSKVFCDRALRDAVCHFGTSREDRIRGLSLDDAADL